MQKRNELTEAYRVSPKEFLMSSPMSKSELSWTIAEISNDQSCRLKGDGMPSDATLRSRPMAHFNREGTTGVDLCFPAPSAKAWACVPALCVTSVRVNAHTRASCQLRTLPLRPYTDSFVSIVLLGPGFLIVCGGFVACERLKAEGCEPCESAWRRRRPCSPGA